MAFKKINKKRQKLIILFLICLFILPAAALNAENHKVIFNHLDGIDDDYGPGDYYYPQNHIFQNKGNLFDLKAVTIFESESEYEFRFSFSNLTDPWGAQYGFSLPLIEVYIDSQSGGSNQLFYSGANISFSNDFYWNKLLKISGWWVRSFNPNSQKQNLLNINDLSLSDPNSNGSIKLIKEANNIFLRLPKTELNSLHNSKLIVLVGSFDPFGYDHFRSLSTTKSYWQIYSENDIPNSSSARVLDILVPAGGNQKEILSGELPEVPYLKIESDRVARESTLVDYLLPVNKISLSILFLYILILIFIIHKYNYKE